MSDNENNVVFISRHLQVRIFQLEVQRLRMEDKFKIMRNELYEMQGQLVTLDHELLQCRKALRNFKEKRSDKFDI